LARFGASGVPAYFARPDADRSVRITRHCDIWARAESATDRLGAIDHDAGVVEASGG